ncbi:MAG: zinc-ribbon domain-containing protein [Cyanobacteriota bacterium]
MSTDFMDNLLKEINSQMDKFSSRLSEVFEIRKVKTEIENLVKKRKNKLMELGTLTFRKVERVEDVKESDINKLIEEIKEINQEISKKKDELDEVIEQEKVKSSSQSSNKENQPQEDILFCPNCGNRTNPQDKFCRQCGNELKRNEE